MTIVDMLGGTMEAITTCATHRKCPKLSSIYTSRKQVNGNRPAFLGMRPAFLRLVAPCCQFGSLYVLFCNLFPGAIFRRGFAETFEPARVAELADALDLGSSAQWAWRFESSLSHCPYLATTYGNLL